MMNYIKISNFREQGKADYKGLSLDQIVPGSQLYPTNENIAIVGYDGEVPVNEEIEIVTVDDYNAKAQEILENTPESIIETLKNENEELKNKQVLMQQALDDLILGGAL